MKLRGFVAFSLVWGLTGCEGCNGSSSGYAFREVPFCATEDPTVSPAFAEHHVILMREGSDSWTMMGLRQQGGRTQVRSWSDHTVFALVRCADATTRASGPALEELIREFDEHVVPVVCSGQRTVFHGRLEAEQDERSRKLGRRGFYRFPEVELKCATGSLRRADGYSLGDILDELRESIEAYASDHEGEMPRSMGSLRDAVPQPALPVDPWGEPLAFSSTGRQVVITSSGPDRTPGTADDIEVFRAEEGGGSHILTFEGTEQSLTADYRAFAGSYVGRSPSADATPSGASARPSAAPSPSNR